MNPLNDALKAATIVAKTITNIDFFVNDDLVVKGQINSLKLEILDFIPYYKTKTTVKTITNKIHLMVPVL